MKYKSIILAAIFTMIYGSMSAQSTSYDSQKFKQWRSMENGKWDFGPDGYYYVWHKGYSGAHWNTDWLAFIPIFSIRFDEGDSNEKRVMLERAAQLVATYEKKDKTVAELDTITPVYNEELKRSLERNVDLMYSQFQKEFNQHQNTITQALSFCLSQSKGELLEAVTIIQNQNDVILSNIDYIHKTGVGYEMENTKREIAYTEQLEKMEKLAALSAKLMLYTKCHYTKQPNLQKSDIINIFPY